jgi:nitroreductase
MMTAAESAGAAGELSGVERWLSHEQFHAVVETAIRAPSMHNSQPWRFRYDGERIEVLADLDRRLPVADPTGWGVRVACGAALFNLRLALAVLGRPAVARLLPKPGDRDLLAHLTRDRPRPATPVEHRLHAAIPRRRSNRFPFENVPVPVDIRAELIRAARDEGCWLDLVLGTQAIEAVAALARAADDILRHDAAYRAEVVAWTRADDRVRDGVPRSAGGPSPRPYELLARRDFGGPPAAEGREYELEPLIGVLGGYGDGVVDQVQAGQALQRVLLTATDRGLAASMVSQPIEVGSVREQLRLALGRHAPPQVVLRFGYAVPSPASGRRPAAEVIEPV